MSSIDEARSAALNFGLTRPDVTTGITRVAPGDYAIAVRADKAVADLPVDFEGVPVSFATYTELRRASQQGPHGRS
jgi:hypothetical protein